MTPINTQHLMAILFAGYLIETRNVHPDEVTACAKLYAQKLSDLADTLVVAAVDRIVKTADRLPTIAKIRAVCVELQHGPPRPGGDAWGEVKAALTRHGRSRYPGDGWDFADPLAKRAVAALGWTELLESENLIADRARFIQLYDQYMAAARIDAQAAPGATSALLPRLAEQVARAAFDRATPTPTLPVPEDPPVKLPAPPVRHPHAVERRGAERAGDAVTRIMRAVPGTIR